MLSEPEVVVAARLAGQVTVQGYAGVAAQHTRLRGREVQPQLVSPRRGAADATVLHLRVVDIVAAGAHADEIRTRRQLDLDVRVRAVVIVVAGDEIEVAVVQREDRIEQAGARVARLFGQPLGECFGVESPRRVDRELVKIDFEARRRVEVLQVCDVGRTGVNTLRSGRRAGRGSGAAPALHCHDRVWGQLGVVAQPQRVSDLLHGSGPEYVAEIRRIIRRNGAVDDHLVAVYDASAGNGGAFDAGITRCATRGPEYPRVAENDRDRIGVTGTRRIGCLLRLVLLELDPATGGIQREDLPHGILPARR